MAKVKKKTKRKEKKKGKLNGIKEKRMKQETRGAYGKILSA